MNPEHHIFSYLFFHTTGIIYYFLAVYSRKEVIPEGILRHRLLNTVVIKALNISVK